MSHLMNSRAGLVADALEGELRVAGGRLVRLDGFPDIRVVLRNEWDRTKVALVSGGGAGHEPAHVGFVGHGMLTAAVCGDVFASPSTEAVLAAVLAVAGPPGVLLIVKNYTGDRLNFGLAAERARALGVRVEMVIVGDDIALPEVAQPRGIAGTLFVHKIAGHAAESGAGLDAVAAAARAAAGATRSIGMALSTCTIPGQRAGNRLAEGEAELGLGIHGEPGAERAALGSARDVVATMLARLGAAADRGPFALLVNNLGGLPPLELAVVADAALAALGSKVGLLLGPAAMMTSLDMKGFSLSLIPLNPARYAALTAPTEASGWPVATVPKAPAMLPLPDAAREGGAAMAQSATTGPATDEAAREVIAAVLKTLIGQEDALNQLDGKVGDGDTGSTVARAARGLCAALDGLVRPSWGETLLGIGHQAGKAMGGSSGVVASIFLAATGTALLRGVTWPEALRAGFERVSFYGGAREGERTMLDALGPAIRALEQGEALEAAAKAAEDGARSTAGIIRTSAGRSSYLKADDLRGVPDPGAVAAAAVFTSLAGILSQRQRQPDGTAR